MVNITYPIRAVFRPSRIRNRYQSMTKRFRSKLKDRVYLRNKIENTKGKAEESFEVLNRALELLTIDEAAKEMGKLKQGDAKLQLQDADSSEEEPMGDPMEVADPMFQLNRALKLLAIDDTKDSDDSSEEW